MPVIRKEYPEGLRSAEMVLVQMLREKRSWQDHMDIKDALWNLRFNAKSMQKERDMINADTNCESTGA